MGVLIVESDFAGKFFVNQDTYNLAKLTAMIADKEEDYLSELLGADLYALFKADLTAKVPISAIYLTIYNAFKKDYNGGIVSSKGMKDMILGFIYFEYMRSVPYKNTSMGAVINQPDLSDSATNSFMGLYKYYNDSVNIFNNIQWKIQQNSSDYPLFNGIRKEITHFF